MATCANFAGDNIHFLQQAVDLVNRISDGAYARTGHALFNSGVGGHLRHCLDHYSNFLAGLPAGRIDYDARARDPDIEKSRARALGVLQRLIEGLRALQPTDGDRRVLVKMDCGEDTDPSLWWTESTVRRELQFLISHTVHHYALIALILRIQGVQTGADFGVAPSTLRYQAGLQCAQ